MLVQGPALPARLVSARSTSATRRPRRTSPTSTPWVGDRRRSLVGLGAPPDLDAAWALEFADGIAEEAALVGASVVGGDLTRADAITIAITALGVCEHGVVRRSGARPGDVVALAGRQGWAGAGFAVLGRGLPLTSRGGRRAPAPSPPYDAGPQAAAARCDRDDRRQRRPAAGPRPRRRRRAGCAIDVDSARLRRPEPLQAVGAALGVDPMRFVPHRGRRLQRSSRRSRPAPSCRSPGGGSGACSSRGDRARHRGRCGVRGRRRSPALPLIERAD